MLPSLLNITIEQVAQGLDDGAFTVTDLVRGYIRRIEEVNHILHAVIQVNPNAESIAKSLDEEVKQYGRRGRVTAKSCKY
jgi:amidase